MALKAKCLYCNKNYNKIVKWQKYCSPTCYNRTQYKRYVKVKCPSCGGKTVRHNMRCRKCYMKQKIEHNRKNIKEIFIKKVVVDNCCWLWQGAIQKDGHGVTNLYPGIRLVHRLSWHLFKFDIPEGKLILHKCYHPNCINPEHLYIGNHSDNLRDAYIKGERNPRGKGKNVRKINKTRISTSK